MTEKYVMNENRIPDGMLHDQNLYEISLENGVLTLSFNIFINKEEYAENDFAMKYYEYKKCHIKCRLEDEMFCNARLETTQNKHGKGKFQYLSINEFLKAASKEIKKSAEKDRHSWEYLYTYVSPNIRGAEIELCAEIKYKGTAYSMCTLELETKEIEFIWE